MPGISRRQLVKLVSAGAAEALGSGLHGQAQVSGHGHSGPNVPVWEVFETAWSGPAEGNPFRDVRFSATFAIDNRKVEVDGFYDGEGRYKVRFMPDSQGSWTLTTHSNRPELDGKTGGFTAIAAKPEAHGPVRVAKTFHFAYADDTPYSPFGTTCYAWIHQTEALQQETLETLRTAPFNKLRMCVFPKSYEYNHNEPELYPFVRDAAGTSDFSRPNPAFYAHLEKRILDLQALGIETDLILFHPYDRWGYATMSAEEDDQYLRYVLARVSSIRSVWWSMANEYDLMRAKTTSDFDRLFHIVERYDAYSHLRSIHYSHTMYDYSHAWVTHASLQTAAFEDAEKFRQQWNKPVIFDEVGYEGNLNRRWGCLSGDEMTRRFWEGVVRGCYVTHGETYLEGEANFREDATPILWWSHGGKLHGTSPQRIGFLRKLTAEMTQQTPLAMGWNPTPEPYYLNAVAFADASAKQVHTLLYYFELHQPIWYEFPLPAGEFTAERIDPESMTIVPIPGKFSGKSKIVLQQRPYQAVRFRLAL
jgi:hypothetical protein